MCYSQIWQNMGGDEYLCKSGKEYLNASLCTFVFYSLQHSETFDVSHDFLPLTTAELSTLKQVRVFLAHPVQTFKPSCKQMQTVIVEKIISFINDGNNELVICSSYLGLVTKMLKDLWYCGDFPCVLAAHVVKKHLPLYEQFPTKPKADICLPQGGIFHAAIQ